MVASSLLTFSVTGHWRNIRDDRRGDAADGVDRHAARATVRKESTPPLKASSPDWKTTAPGSPTGARASNLSTPAAKPSVPDAAAPVYFADSANAAKSSGTPTKK